MSSMIVRLLPLHENGNYQNQVIDLLNDQWPQSKTIRLRRLERSCEQFPLSYILLDDKNELLGYCYVDRLYDDEHSVIIESVCIDRQRRGQGYGRKLMELLEDKLRENYPQIEMIYLTTTEKRDFYEKCGYEETSPRVRLNVSSKLFNGNEELLKNLLANQNVVSPSSSSHVILQKGSTIARIPTVWMRKPIRHVSSFSQSMK